jgi:hypothetical protein
MLLIRNQGASLFNDLELEWPRYHLNGLAARLLDAEAA